MYFEEQKLLFYFVLFVVMYTIMLRSLSMNTYRFGKEGYF